MTAICPGGGTSSARPGFAEALFVGPGAIAALLNNVPTIWAVPLAAYIGAVTYNLSTFCTTDPPAMPTITALDVVALLNVYDPVSNPPAAEKFQQLIGALLWHQVCRCDSGSATVATPPSDPGGWDVSPQVGTPTTNQPCWVSDENIMTPYLTTFPLPIYGKIHQGETTVELEVWQTDGGGPHGNMTFQVYWQNDSFTTIHLETALPMPFQVPHLTVDYPWYPGATYVFSRWNSAAQPTSHDQGHAIMRFFCGNDPQNLPAPCGPPDPILQAQVERILGLVTLIQRQVAPFAYVSGATHAGLTGDGSISVQGLIGARFEITATSSAQGEIEGDPSVRFDAGWFNWGNDDGVTAREFLSADQQVSFPVAAGQYTAIHYSLGVGVELSIIELVREP